MFDATEVRHLQVSKLLAKPVPQQDEKLPRSSLKNKFERYLGLLLSSCHDYHQWEFLAGFDDESASQFREKYPAEADPDRQLWCREVKNIIRTRLANGTITRQHIDVIRGVA
jgi:hypothetical protein